MALVQRALCLGLLSSALASLLGACGWYTNVPAAIVAVGVSPGRVLFETKGTETVITTVNPKVTFRADPGSIGATFDAIQVSYTRYDRTKVDASQIPEIVIGANVRVDGSVYPDNPLAVGPLDQSKVGSVVYVGRFEYEIPVINRYVESFGSKISQNQAGVNAICVFKGVDDANWPIEVPVNVPIVFNGTPPNP